IMQSVTIVVQKTGTKRYLLPVIFLENAALGRQERCVQELQAAVERGILVLFYYKGISFIIQVLCSYPVCQRQFHINFSFARQHIPVQVYNILFSCILYALR